MSQLKVVGFIAKWLNSASSGTGLWREQVKKKIYWCSWSSTSYLSRLKARSPIVLQHLWLNWRPAVLRAPWQHHHLPWAQLRLVLLQAGWQHTLHQLPPCHRCTCCSKTDIQEGVCSLPAAGPAKGPVPICCPDLASIATAAVRREAVRSRSLSTDADVGVVLFSLLWLTPV